jgi:hypothetical protein
MLEAIDGTRSNYSTSCPPRLMPTRCAKRRWEAPGTIRCFSKHVLTEPCECVAYLNGRRSLDVEWDVDEQRCSTADGTLDCHLPAERLDAVDQTGQP